MPDDIEILWSECEFKLPATPDGILVQIPSQRSHDGASTMNILRADGRVERQVVSNSP